MPKQGYQRKPPTEDWQQSQVNGRAVPQERSGAAMKAIRLHTKSSPTGMVYEEVPQPHPKEGEVLVRVYAAAMTHSSLFVENIAVDPRFQGQGLGQRLMAFVEQQARNEQLQEIRLYTNEVMTENLRFSHKLGFEEEGRRVEDGRPDRNSVNDWLDSVCFL